MARTRRSRSPRSPYYHFLLRRTRSRLLLRPHLPVTDLMDHRKQQQRSGASAASSAKHGGGGKGSGKAGVGGSGGKKPIKVVYISNPMRVKTNAADFRALVQELTGRHADPSKYSAAARQELSPEGSAAASMPDAAAPSPAAAPDFAAAAFGDGDEEEQDIFSSQLLDNEYSVFSPPPLLYDYTHGSNKV